MKINVVRMTTLCQYCLTDDIDIKIMKAVFEGRERSLDR